MTDSKLQALQRTWESSGCVVDEVACLVERLRVGELSRAKLELAAYCGHEASAQVVGPPEDAPRDLRVWNDGLGRVGREGSVRGALAALQALAARAFVAGSPSCAVVEAVEAWALSPERSTVQRVREAADATSQGDALAPNPAWHVTQRVSLEEGLAADLASVVFERSFKVRAGYFLERLCEASAHSADGRLVDSQRRAGSRAVSKQSQAARRAMRLELIGWALGYRDFVRERVASR